MTMTAKKISLRTALICGFASLILVGTLGTGQAQEKRGEGVDAKEAKDFSARGIRSGSFVVFPAINVIERYDDNIFKTNTLESDDFITTIHPELKVNSDFSRHALNLNVNADIVRFADFNADDHDDFSAGVDGRIDILKALTVNLGLTHSISAEERGSPNAANGISPTDTDTTTLTASASYKPGKLSVKLDGSFNKKNFDDVRTSTGITNNDDRDRDEFDISARVGFEYLPKTDAFVKASYNTISYDVEASQDDNGEDRDSDGFEVVVGTGLDFTGVTTGEVFAGYLRQKYDDANLGRLGGAVVGASVRWEATELTTVRGSVSRTANETTTANVPGFLQTGTELRINHEFLRNLTARVKLKYRIADYENIARKDYTMTGAVGAQYKLNRNFWAGAEYQYKEKDSNQGAGSDWEDNRYEVSLRAQF